MVMAQFDTEYQRLEASYSDSPPGEEDLLVHVPEGSKCEFSDRQQRRDLGRELVEEHRGSKGLLFLQGSDISAPVPTAPWHHIENLDLFFSRISFVSLRWSYGTFSPFLSQTPDGKLGWV